MTYGLLCAKELLIGLLMGYILTLFFSVAFTAGQLVDMQMGFGMANVFDEQSNASVPMLGNLFNVMLMLCFVAVGGFERLVAMLDLTIRRIPIGAIRVDAGLAWTVAELFCQAFLLGVRMALPVIASGLLAEGVMGVLVRTVPQMNVFVIGLPLKVVLGFAIILAVLPIYIPFSSLIFDTMFAGIERAFASLAAA